MKRITEIAITLAAVLGGSYAGPASAAGPSSAADVRVEMCQELSKYI